MRHDERGDLSKAGGCDAQHRESYRLCAELISLVEIMQRCRREWETVLWNGGREKTGKHKKDSASHSMFVQALVTAHNCFHVHLLRQTYQGFACTVNEYNCMSGTSHSKAVPPDHAQPTLPQQLATMVH